MNPPSTKSMFSSTGHSMSQCDSVKKIRWWVQYVIALGFCVLSRKIYVCTRIAICENVLKLSILHINSVFYHWIPYGGAAKIVCVKIVLGYRFCVLSRKLSICTKIVIPEKRLKIVHSTYWKCFYHRIPYGALGLKVKNPCEFFISKKT